MRPSSYKRAGPALLRAALLPCSATPSSWPALPEAGVEELRAWVSQVWPRHPASAAIRAASPVLSKAMDAVVSGRLVDGRRVRKSTVSLVRYLLRACYRPTPFGLFAGTTPVRFTVSGGGEAVWGTEHRAVVRADTGWADEIVTYLMTTPGMLESLEVVADNTLWVRGNRLIRPTGTQRVEASYTAPVRAVLSAAATPVSMADLLAKLADEFPRTPADLMLGLVADLTSHGFLFSGLRVPMTTSNTVAYLLEKTVGSGGEEKPQAVGTVARLRAVEKAVGEHQIEQAGELATSLPGTLAMDLRLDWRGRIPEVVAGEIESASSVLLRLSPHPRGHPVWRDYYEQFMHRYGAGVLVSLADLVNPDMGLGLPAGYPGSLRPEPSKSVPERDQRLLALLQEATVTRRREIVLDDETVERLAVAGPVAAPPPHLEIAARVYAASMAAIDLGRFTVSVRPGRAIGVMTGRFTQPGSDMAKVYAALPPSTKGAITAQLLFEPLTASAGNVARTSRFCANVIPVGGHPSLRGAGVIELGDLAVLADERRLHLVHVPTNQVVEPQVPHGLALDTQAPPLARFLANLPGGCAIQVTRFDWGTARRLPFLPRVRYRRAILAPACWRLEAPDLPGRWKEKEDWSACLDEWRRVWRVPRKVELIEGDRTLRLDLEEPAHTFLLRARLDREGTALLTETFAESDLGWLDGHAHELVVPLVSTASPLPSPLEGSPPPKTTDRRRGQIPAEPAARWLNVKLYAHPGRHDDILAGSLPELLAELDDPAWWFIRFRAPGDPDHLRLRLCVEDASMATRFIKIIGEWSAALRADGLLTRTALDTYFPEIGRYGVGKVLEAAETVFAADSAMVAAHLRGGEDVDPCAATAAGMVRIACGLAGGTAAGTRWFLDHPPDPRARAIARRVTIQTIALTDPDRPSSPEEKALEAALNIYRDRLEETGRPSVDGVISSLLHMHHIRRIGVDRDSERTCYRVARQAGLSWRARGKSGA